MLKVGNECIESVEGKESKEGENDVFYLKFPLMRCTFVHMITEFQKGFRRLLAWQEAHKLTLGIYRTTTSFPQEERFGITSQLRRAASSIAAQITEGSRMESPKHRQLYYNRAYASAAEVDYFLELSHDLHYLTDEQYNALLDSVNRASFLVHKLSLSCHSSPATHAQPS
ncbi:MAG: four helix bundle protein [Candidatus Peribacter sp.]|nr:four helix bundle protein [Candidatus Peribacter sp.]